MRSKWMARYINNCPTGQFLGSRDDVPAGGCSSFSCSPKLTTLHHRGIFSLWCDVCWCRWRGKYGTHSFPVPFFDNRSIVCCWVSCWDVCVCALKRQKDRALQEISYRDEGPCSNSVHLYVSCFSLMRTPSSLWILTCTGHCSTKCSHFNKLQAWLTRTWEEEIDRRREGGTIEQNNCFKNCINNESRSGTLGFTLMDNMDRKTSLFIVMFAHRFHPVEERGCSTNVQCLLLWPIIMPSFSGVYKLQS